MTTDFELLDGPWEAVGHLAAPVRIAVFMDEQRVPRILEWDGADETALHVVAIAPNGDAVATARLLPDGHVGRMAVLREWRGLGLGRLIMERTVAVARRNGHTQLLLAAQLHAIPFYERLGFEPYGGVFEDAGIDHRMMRRTLED